MGYIVVIGIIIFLIFFFRPFSRYKRSVLKEYRNWRGYNLSPINQNFINLLRAMKKQGLTPREARLVICTYQDKGDIEGTRHMSAIISGKQYKPLSENDDNNINMKLTETHFVEIGRKLKEEFDKQCQHTLYSFKEMCKKHDLKLNNSLNFEIICLLYFAFDFGISAGHEVTIRENIRDAFTEAIVSSNPNAEEISNRVMEYVNAYKSKGDNIQRLIAVGKIFAKYTDNENDSLVITWANTILGTNFNFISTAINNIISDN